MEQALQDGPIICYMGVTEEFEAYRGFGIFQDTTGDESLDHVISLVGYGEQDGTPYWIGYVAMTHSVGEWMRAESHAYE